MTAYYNEIEPYAAAWLRNLISENLIAPGDVDERSIADVTPADIAGYTQCHFFAGIGVWSASLRQAGWSDDTPVWTGSCPCQPFSAAGKGSGFDDERHLWPAWYHLISACRPPSIFGEQVASPNGYSWLDLVQADLEGAAYACRPVVLPAAGFGAPHGRHRIFWVADAAVEGRGSRSERDAGAHGRPAPQSGRLCDAGNMGLPISPRLEGHTGDGDHGDKSRWIDQEPRRSVAEASAAGRNNPDAPVNGFWFDADWIYCRDEKWRPVEPGAFPLVDGLAFKLGSGSAFAGRSRAKMLRGYGNAIVKEVAAEFIKASMNEQE
jgi:DNA (cytosine-5)-methyltransferase 1